MRGSQKNINYKIEWSPDFAYAIGLIATDGCLSKNGRGIDFTSKDIQLVETFRNCLKLSNVKIGQKNSGTVSKKIYFRIQFSNIKLYNWLIKIGITPKKSKTIGTINIPKNYFFDLLRGLFDGDGSVYTFINKKWKNSFILYTSFNSASLEHLQWVREEIKKRISISGCIIKCKRIFILRYAKADSKKLIQKMYCKDNAPCCQRKYDKIKSLLKIDDERTKNRIEARVVKLVNTLV